MFNSRVLSINAQTSHKALMTAHLYKWERQYRFTSNAINPQCIPSNPAVLTWFRNKHLLTVSAKCEWKYGFLRTKATIFSNIIHYIYQIVLTPLGLLMFTNIPSSNYAGPFDLLLLSLTSFSLVKREPFFFLCLTVSLLINFGKIDIILGRISSYDLKF